MIFIGGNMNSKFLVDNYYFDKEMYEELGEIL